MRAADLGWASAGEDASVNELERRGAELLGKEAAVLVPTCTMANLAALLAQGRPGQSVVVEASAHVMTSESDGISTLAGLAPFALDGEGGRLEPGEVDRAFRRSGGALLCLENTHTRAGGTVLDVERTEALAGAARRYGARVHLDGARLPNAAVALGVPLAALAAPVDTVSLSLNKGLAAPFGALLAGDAATIAAARVHARRLGGGTMHKAGIAAAAGLVALAQVDRLAEDNRRASELARLLGLGEAETNIVLTELPVDALRRATSRGVLALAPDGARAARDPPRHRRRGRRRAAEAVRASARRLRAVAAGAVRRSRTMPHAAVADRDDAGGGERELASRPSRSASRRAGRRPARRRGTRRSRAPAARPRRCSGASSWIVESAFVPHSVYVIPVRKSSTQTIGSECCGASSSSKKPKPAAPTSSSRRLARLATVALIIAPHERARSEHRGDQAEDLRARVERAVGDERQQHVEVERERREREHGDEGDERAARVADEAERVGGAAEHGRLAVAAHRAASRDVSSASRQPTITR